MNVKDNRKTVTTAGTAVQLGASEAITEVTITALSGNTGTIAVGGTTVVAAVGATRRGTQLAAGASYTVVTDDLGDIWIDATVNGEGVSYSYISEA